MSSDCSVPVHCVLIILNGYSFEPEYSEQEMETPDETVPLRRFHSKNGAICGHCCEVRKSEENVGCKHSDLSIPNSIENSKELSVCDVTT